MTTEGFSTDNSEKVIAYTYKWSDMLTNESITIICGFRRWEDAESCSEFQLWVKAKGRPFIERVKRWVKNEVNSL